MWGPMWGQFHSSTIIPTESINDAKLIPHEDNYNELSHQNKVEFKKSRNDIDLKETSQYEELSSTSKENVIENASAMPSVNSLPNPNATATSVYKLTQVQKTQGHKFTVTRREITKLKSNGEKSPKGTSLGVETSFPFVERKGSKETGDTGANVSQLSRDLKEDTWDSQGDMQMRQSGLNLERNIGASSSLLLETMDNFESTETASKNDEIIQATLHEICDSKVFDREQLCEQVSDNSNSKDEFSKHGFVSKILSTDVNEPVDNELSEGDVNELSDSLLLDHDVSTCLEESNCVRVDNSGDNSFKIIRQSVKVGSLEQSWEQNNPAEFALDENENCESLSGNSELAKNWKSFPSRGGAQCIGYSESDSNSSDIGDIDDNTGHSGVVQAGSMGVGNDTFEQESSGITDQPLQMQNAGELEINEEIKDAHLLSFENRIGTRKAIFLKDSAASRKDEQCDIVVARNVEDISSFGQEKHEDAVPDTMELEISDEIVVAEPVQTCNVEGDCPLPVQDGTIPDDPVPFARANVTEEDVLMAKIITIQEPEVPIMDIESSSFDNEQICSIAATDLETIEKKSATEECPVPLKTENNMLENAQSSSEQTCTAETNTDIPNSRDNVVDSVVIGGDSKRTVTEITNTKVLSMVQKFEEARKRKSCEQTENACTDSSDDTNGTTVINHSSAKPLEEERRNLVVDEECQSTSIYSNEDGDFLKKNIVKDPKLLVDSQISEPASVASVTDESKVAELSNSNADNSVVDDSKVPIPAFRVKIEQSYLPDEQSYLPDENVPDNVPTSLIEDVNNSYDNSELEETAVNTTRSRNSLEKLESDSDVTNSEDTIESAEEIVIYANQVTELYACDEKQTVGETIERIHARPVSDCGVTVVYAGEVIESENTTGTYCLTENKSKQRTMDDSRTTIVYANQVDENEATAVIDENQIIENGIDPRSTVKPTNIVHSVLIPLTDIAEEEQNSTQEGVEVDISCPEPVSTQLKQESSNFEETCFDVTPISSNPKSSPPEEQDNAVSDAKLPFSSTLNPVLNDCRSKEDLVNFDKMSENYKLVLSPVGIQENIPSSQNLPTSSSPILELKEILSETEENPSVSSKIRSEPKQSPYEPSESRTEPNKNLFEAKISPPDLRGSSSLAKESLSEPSPFVSKESTSKAWKSLPRGETDVDSFSDIDEIDINILPDENYQKSKSVTDLDEALASFGGLDYLSTHALDQDNMSGGLSKSVPDILDSCREESLKAIPIDKLKKKNLSSSTPEINSEPGSKKVTKIKIVHVKFLEMQSDSENVEEDSFIYEGDLPITGIMKRRSKNLSDEFSSPVASPPPDLNKEVAQERSIAGKTNLKQLEFEFGDLFLNSPSPPPLESTGSGTKDESSTNESTRPLQRRSDVSKGTTNRQNVCAALPEDSAYNTATQIPTVRKISPGSRHSTYTKAKSEVQNPSLTDMNGTTISATNTLKYEELNKKAVTREGSSSARTDYNTTSLRSNRQISKDTRLDTAKHAFLKPETNATSSVEKLYQTSNSIRSSTVTSRNATSYKNVTKNNQSEIVSRSSTKTDSRSYRYIPGNTQSYSKAPKPVPEEEKYVVKSGMVTTQSTTAQSNSRKITTQVRYTESSNSPLHITTQARFIDSPNTSSPSSSPRRGLRLAEKFHMSDDGNLAQRPAGSKDQIDGPVSTRYRTDGRILDGTKTRKPDHPESAAKGTSCKLVTVKSGIISDYECSSDADSEMSYNVPSPRVKAKRYHRPQVHRVDSASSSEPDSPRRQQKDDRRSMSELFGVDKGYLCSSDTSKDGFGKESGSQNSLREPKLFSRFGELRQKEEAVNRQNETFVERNQNPPYIYQAKATIFDPRPIEAGLNKQRTSENIVERNTAPSYVSPTRTAIFRSDNQSNVPQSRPTMCDETGQQFKRLQQSNAVDRNPIPTRVHQARTTTFNQRLIESRRSIPRNTSALERNLSPTNFLQEGNLGYDDEMPSKSMEFNPFDANEDGDGFQPLERCHSPSSVYSDTSSVFSFNCDFDPMPPPTAKFEPEVYTCENPMCKKKDILLGPEKTTFKSCPACFTYYCSSECRKLHWPSHKQSCYFGRVNTYVRSIIRLCQRREDLSMYLSQLARDGYKKKGRGVVMAIFNNPELAREFITKGHDAFSGRKPTYSSLAELHREGIISKHRVALMQAVRDYEPNQEFVFNIAVVATNNIPITPAPRYKLNTVLHCIKMPLNDVIVARQPKDFDQVETRLFALPKCSRHEFVNEMEARRHYCRNLSKNLRQYNIKLKDDYPECYRKLCLYVEHNIPFEPMIIYGQRSGLSYKCVIAPEQSYPLNAEYC